MIFNIDRLFKKGIQKEVSAKKQEQGDIKKDLPITRQTVNTDKVSLLSLLQDGDMIIKDDIPKRFFDAIENLVIYNPDFSHVLDNTVQLANTDFTVSFNDDAEYTDSMHKEVKSVMDSWYNYSGGINSLRNDLTVQLAVYGVLSAEIIVNNNLTGVDKVIKVKPTSIKFKYDTVTGDYVPYQKQKQENVKLNQNTYKYHTLRRIGEKPYAIPPMLSALENVLIEKDMIGNIREIVKNLGILGFLEVLIRRPDIDVKNNESDDDYKTRAKQILNDTTTQIRQGMSNGFLVGFQGEHEINMRTPSAGGSAQGVSALMRLNTEQKMSGLKQSPFMVGRNYSTTESLGKVVITMLGSQVKNYQAIIDNFLSDVFKLHLQLKGYTLDYVKVISDKPLIEDENKTQEAFSKKIENQRKLYEDGLIDQETRARNLGLDSPVLDSPRGEVSNDAVTDADVDVAANSIGTIQIDYSHTHDNEVESFDYPNRPLMSKNFNGYYGATKKQYDKAIKSFLKSYSKFISSSSKKVSENTFINKALYELYKGWNDNFTTKEIVIIKKWVRSAYKEFRNDSITVFGKGVEVPKATLSLIDYRALEYFQDVDAIYLGKFITDPAIKKNITAFIKSEYLEHGFAVGDAKSLEQFEKRFGNLLNAETWRIKSILMTSVSKMRNWASLNYMQQAKVTKFVVRGIDDYLQCPYCAGMQGKVFEVEKSINKINAAMDEGVDKLSDATPFMTSVFYSDMKGLSGEEITAKIKEMDAKDIQLTGIAEPPFHPRCRDVIVAEME